MEIETKEGFTGEIEDKRCDTTELIVSQCACRSCRNIRESKPTDGILARSFFSAKYNGRCCLEYSHMISEGDDVSFVVNAASMSETLGTACAGCTEIILNTE